MGKRSNATECRACTPIPVDSSFFNPACKLPYGLTIDHIHQAMEEFVRFLCLINRQLRKNTFPRLESILMPANFSSIVGEFMNVAIPQYCSNLVQNRYHNGHPDLLPSGMFPGDEVQYGHAGIEVKASRSAAGWQGHNPESVWLMVFHFGSNTSRDRLRGRAPAPFRFLGVYAAQLVKDDWNFSGRSSTSRRTITASVNQSGMQKMHANWVYQI